MTQSNENIQVLDFLNEMKNNINNIDNEHKSTIGSLADDVDICIRDVKDDKESEVNILELNDRFVDIQRKLSAPQELKDLKENIKNALKTDEENVMDELHNEK